MILLSRNRKWLVLNIVALFGLFIPELWCQQSYSLESVRFMPPEYYVGEKVDLRITLHVPEEVPLSVPSEIPELSWITFHDIEIVRKGNIAEVGILFSTFQPGLKTIPPLDLGGILLEPVKIHTTAILDIDPPPFSDPAGQMLLPGTTFFIIAVIALCLIVPTLAISLGYRVRRFFQTVAIQRRRKRPLDRFKKIIEELKTDDTEVTGNWFYSILSLEFRIYLSDRTGTDFLSTTTGEFNRHFRQVIPDKKIAGEITEVLNRGDGAKFGGRRVSRKEYSTALSTIEKAVVRIEELLLRREKKALDRSEQ